MEAAPTPALPQLWGRELLKPYIAPASCAITAVCHPSPRVLGEGLGERAIQQNVDPSLYMADSINACLRSQRRSVRET